MNTYTKPIFGILFLLCNILFNYPTVVHADTTSEVRRLESLNRNLMGDIRSLENKINDLKDEVRELENKLRSEKSKTTELENKIRRLQSNLGARERKVQKLNGPTEDQAPGIESE